MKITRREYPSLREQVYEAQLPSGLTVMAVPRTGWSRYFAILMTAYGSNDNQFVLPGETRPTKVPDGIAHFLEHQLFAQPDGSADDRFASLGASSNAFTSWTRTGYLFSTTGNYQQCLRYLLDFVYQPYFTEAGTAREQGIIQQEIGMFLDDPRWQVYLNLLQGMYHHHPVRRDIAGSVESVGQVSKQLLDLCYQTFYQPSNMVLVTVGDFDPEQVLETAAEQMAGKNLAAQPPVQRIFPAEPPSIHRQRTSLKASVSTPLFALGFKERQPAGRGEDLLRRQVLTEVVLHAVIGSSSALYQQLYNEGLIDNSFQSGYSGQPDYGYTVLQGESKDPERLRDRLLAGLDKLRQAGISREDWQRSQRALQGHFLQSLNSMDNLASDLADVWFDGIDYLHYPDVLSQLTLDMANQRLLEHLQPQEAALSEVLPL